MVQVLESEMSNQDSGAKIDGVDVNQVCVRDRETERDTVRWGERGEIKRQEATMDFHALCSVGTRIAVGLS